MQAAHREQIFARVGSRVSHIFEHTVAVRASQALLVALYLALWGYSAMGTLNPTDLDVFFLPAAQVALHGHPLLVYTVRYSGNYPNANGPLSLVPLTAAAWIAQQLGWLGNHILRRIVIMVIFAVFPLLMAREAVQVVDRFGAKSLTGWHRLLAYAVFVLTPQLWHSTLFYGHIEQPIMIWLVLLAVRLLVEDHARAAGLAMGLALLTRSAALVFLLPLVVVLLLRQRQVRRAVWLAGISGAVVLACILPFLLADAHDVVYSLVTFRGGLPVAGGNLWGVLLNSPARAFADRWDSETVIAAVLLLSLLAVMLRRDLTINSPALYALLALASLCFPMFIKTLWPYYFLEPYVFIAVWWLVRARQVAVGRRRWVLPLGALLLVDVLVCAQVAEGGTTSATTPALIVTWSIPVTIGMTALMLALIVWLAVARAPAPAVSASRQRGILDSGPAPAALSAAPDR